MKIHHIGYLVKNIEKAKAKFLLLGFKEVKKSCYDQHRKINISFMENHGYTLELVAPAEEDSVVTELLKKYRNTPYHLCYIADNFEKDCQELINNKFTQIDPPTPAPAIDNKRVTFFINASIGIIELLEQ